jgi:sugar phosphate isomerase/epimerase
VLARGEVDQVHWARRLGFRSLQWMRFEQSGAGLAQADWRPYAEQLAVAAREADVRLSAIGAFYRNPLDPRQSDRARAVWHRAIEVAAHLRVRTVSGFAGGVIETELNDRGGNPVYRPLENYLPQMVAFWEPIARYAADRGVRLAFENCPQSPYSLPAMGYNLMAMPALWERFFAALPCTNVGLEWDPSHLVCQLIDPVENLRRFGARVFHVHAKDAWVDPVLLRTYGICHPGVAEHRLPGFGQCDWAQIIHALLRAGYDSDVNVEGWHDPVFRRRAPEQPSAAAAGAPLPDLEEAGFIAARKLLEQWVPQDR